jgi:hypothetical protein
MASKRAREDRDVQERSHKKHKKGFSVGPQNLPDGTYRRKLDKIKKNLIHKAKVKKDFAKLKARLEKQEQKPTSTATAEPATRNDEPPTSLEPHPDRLALLSQPEQPQNPARSNTNKDTSNSKPSQPKSSELKKQRRPQYSPFSKAAQEAKKRKKEAERRQRELERVEKEKKEKAEQRDRHRMVMAKARRGGRNGQRSLATEGEVLLERVKKLMGQERSSGVVSFGGKKEKTVHEARTEKE